MIGPVLSLLALSSSVYASGTYAIQETHEPTLTNVNPTFAGNVTKGPVPPHADAKAPAGLKKRWNLAWSAEGSGFFDDWTFWSGDDPTHGQVNFHGADSALAYIGSDGNAIIKVDDTNDLASGANRGSIRITSNYAVNENSLVITQLNHIPYGCATWPAFWMVGPNWPAGGEIDILEGVNLNGNNQMTLHTNPGCTHDPNAGETGSLGSVSDCNSANGANGNAGCSVIDTNTQSYGDNFNNNGGGVWATQWLGTGISIWFFPAGSIPADITANAPDPGTWPATSTAFFPFGTGYCDTSFFNNLNIVFDITLCGDWAGNAYSATCGSATCSSEVESAGNFHDAWFDVSFVRVYT